LPRDSSSTKERWPDGLLNFLTSRKPPRQTKAATKSTLKAADVVHEGFEKQESVPTVVAGAKVDQGIGVVGLSMQVQTGQRVFSRISTEQFWM